MKKSARRYEYKLTLGKDFTGKYQRKSFYSCKSKSDAKKKAEAWKLEHEMELFLTGEAPIKRMKFCRRYSSARYAQKRLQAS